MRYTLVEFQAQLHTEESLHYMMDWTPTGNEFLPRHQTISGAQPDTYSINTGDTLFRSV
jgi:hypothetical protein